jgi:acylphosphatase
MSTDTGISARRFFVSGRVQGVFFRASTRTQAERLGLRGHALNLPDGRVEVLAVGTPAAVAELADWLRQGPPAARVDAIDVEIPAAEDCANIASFSCG